MEIYHLEYNHAKIILVNLKTWNLNLIHLASQNKKEISINISYYGNYISFVISYNEIGIDIEYTNGNDNDLL
ncbi:hypothetical protein X276_04705 [Clostridium beijerinckii NRRL B-598]|nr:hypothetical protein X276_04705 [Clostridium beijerinckii NRRL B-598]